MQLRSFPRVAMQKLLMRFFFPMRAFAVRPGIAVSSPSQSQCEVFMIAAASGWHPRQRCVTACGEASGPVITEA